MDLFELPRPEHVAQPAWDSIELALSRLRRAWEFDDLPDVVGKAKELVETVAKVTVEAAEGAVSDAVDFQPIVKAAQKALGRQPGADLSQDQNLRAMSQAAQTIATSLAPIRNGYGTGHGRARVPDVVVEMATLSLESALMWSRWALRRLGHLLADYPNELIASVQTGTSRKVLKEKFEASALAQQPSEVQHRIGVVFGQQSAGGFGNATEVGVEPAVEGGYDEYPIDYRRGLLEGMLLTGGGSVGLTGFYAPWFVSLLSSLPEREAQSALEALRESVTGAPWIGTWRGSTKVEPADVVSALRSEGERLHPGFAEPFQALCNELLHSGESAKLEDKD
ncbi:abortive infection family protein [Plantactinospora siamensis]|uniref:Abortive infection family protein n=1 Tax=Plantactinospora siamensis TaxID=555372 RepID=A0ABV6P5C3_9ACTN